MDLPHLLPFPAAADLRQQIILLHDSQHSFGVAENILGIQPQPPVPIGTEPAFPLLCDSLRKSCILFRSAQAMDKGVAAASGCSSAHDSDWILHPLTIYDVVFDLCPHFLPVKCRKSRSSLFLHAQLLGLICLLCHNVSGCGIFPWSSSGPWNDAGCQLPFFSPLTLKRNRQISLRIKRPPSQCLCIEMAACSSIMI